MRNCVLLHLVAVGSIQPSLYLSVYLLFWGVCVNKCYLPVSESRRNSPWEVASLGDGGRILVWFCVGTRVACRIWKVVGTRGRDWFNERLCETIHQMGCFGTEVKVCGVGEGGKGTLDLFNQRSDLHWQVDKWARSQGSSSFDMTSRGTTGKSHGDTPSVFGTQKEGYGGCSMGNLLVRDVCGLM